MKVSAIDYQNQQANFGSQIKAPKAFWEGIENIKNLSAEDSFRQKVITSLEDISKYDRPKIIQLKEKSVFSMKIFEAINKDTEAIITQTPEGGWMDFLLQTAEALTHKNRNKVQAENAKLDRLVKNIKSK